MNKYQQALNTLREKGYTNHFQPIKLEYQYPNEFKTLQELVDKATPKKIIPRWRKGYDPKLYYPKSFYCPSCGRKLRIDQFYKWCPDCNQALEKWSDEDDR